MATLDPSIYGQLQPNLAMGMGDIVNRYVDQTQADADRKNKLAMLAQQGQMQDIQLQQARNELAMQPQRQEEARRAKEAKYMQDVAREIAASPEQKDMILNRHAELAPQFGIDPNHITWLASDLANSQNVQDRALYHADPQEYMKKQLEEKFRKPAAPSWHIIETGKGQMIVNANDPNAPKVFGAKPKAAQLMQEPPPKAAPGTRVYKDAEGNWQTEILKGSPQWQTQKSKEATDRAFVQNTVPTFEKNVKDIESLVSDKGFDSIFGLTGAYTPDITASARSARAKLEQVAGAMETAGYNMMKSTSGSAGSMSQQEWPKMQTYFNIIKNSSDPAQVKEALAGAIESYKRMQDIAKESYMNEWGTGQFGDPSVIQRLGAATRKSPPATNHPTDIQAILNKHR